MTFENSRHLLAQLINSANIVEVVTAHFPLKRAGRRLVAPCPFHDDSGNNLMISEEKQTFHCYNCTANGTAIDFLMKYHKIEYRQAAQDLADFLGIAAIVELEEKARPSLPREAQRLVDTLTKAATFYVQELKGSARAREYLEKRGLADSVIVAMDIGYAPQGWQALGGAFPLYEDQAMIDAGLVLQREDGKGRYDRFRDRIMFPIRNEDGHVIGFGGRVIEHGDPKYLNSPETSVFSKHRELYGLFEAKEAIQSEGFALVTEGYMDVVALRQASFENAVATLGTATGTEHIDKLLRHTRRLVYSFDGDKAGQKAAWRAFESALPYMRDDVHFNFLFLPEEHDPDSYIAEHGRTAFDQLVKTSAPASQFAINELTKRYPTTSLEGRMRFLKAATPLLRQMPLGNARLTLTAAVAERASLQTGEVAYLSGLPPSAWTTLARDVVAPNIGSNMPNRI